MRPRHRTYFLLLKILVVFNFLLLDSNPRIRPKNHVSGAFEALQFRASHRFKSCDSGRNWTDAGQMLPDVPALAVAVDPLYPDDVFVGNDDPFYAS